MKQTFYVTDDLCAGHGLRIANYLIDVVVLYALTFVVALIVALIARFLDSPNTLLWMAGMNRIEQYLVGLFIMLVYYNAMEIPLSRTVGKFITGTVVVDMYGEKPTTNDILKRTFCRLIPFESFSYLGTPSRGWHDTMPDLYVVSKKQLEEALQQFRDFNEFGNTEAEI